MAVYKVQAILQGHMYPPPLTQRASYPVHSWSDVWGVGRGLKREPESKWAGKQANKQTNKKRAGEVGPRAIYRERMEQAMQ